MLTPAFMGRLFRKNGVDNRSMLSERLALRDSSLGSLLAFSLNYNGHPRLIPAARCVLQADYQHSGGIDGNC
jgi:hypothetical protein